jgi:hypothetical protein
MEAASLGAVGKLTGSQGAIRQDQRIASVTVGERGINRQFERLLAFLGQPRHIDETQDRKDEEATSKIGS